MTTYQTTFPNLLQVVDFGNPDKLFCIDALSPNSNKSALHSRILFTPVTLERLRITSGIVALFDITSSISRVLAIHLLSVASILTCIYSKRLQ